MTRAAKKPPGAYVRVLVELEPDMDERVLAHAQRRNLTKAEFLARLIETAVADDCVGTILGDEE